MQQARLNILCSILFTILLFLASVFQPVFAETSKVIFSNYDNGAVNLYQMDPI